MDLQNIIILINSNRRISQDFYIQKSIKELCLSNTLYEQIILSDGIYLELISEITDGIQIRPETYQKIENANNKISIIEIRTNLSFFLTSLSEELDNCDISSPIKDNIHELLFLSSTLTLLPEQILPFSEKFDLFYNTIKQTYPPLFETNSSNLLLIGNLTLFFQVLCQYKYSLNLIFEWVQQFQASDSPPLIHPKELIEDEIFHMFDFDI